MLNVKQKVLFTAFDIVIISEISQPELLQINNKVNALNVEIKNRIFHLIYELNKVHS